MVEQLEVLQKIVLTVEGIVEFFRGLRDGVNTGAVTTESGGSATTFLIGVAIVVIVVSILKKFELAGKILKWVMVLTLVFKLLSFAGYHNPFIEQWLDIFRMIVMLI